MLIKINNWLIENQENLSWQARLHAERIMHPEKYNKEETNVVTFEQKKVN